MFPYNKNSQVAHYVVRALKVCKIFMEWTWAAFVVWNFGTDYLRAYFWTGY